MNETQSQVVAANERLLINKLSSSDHLYCSALGMFALYPRMCQISGVLQLMNVRGS